MNILYELEFDLDGFIESMEQQKSARRRIEEHMEMRRLRDELSLDEEFELDPQPKHRNVC
ncbi:MAG TPA: hypothetical protein VF322_08510 [Gammaproteobacteria bacterium]